MGPSNQENSTGVSDRINPLLVNFYQHTLTQWQLLRMFSKIGRISTSLASCIFSILYTTTYFTFRLYQAKTRHAFYRDYI